MYISTTEACARTVGCTNHLQSGPKARSGALSKSEHEEHLGVGLRYAQAPREKRETKWDTAWHDCVLLSVTRSTTARKRATECHLHPYTSALAP